MLPEQFGVLDSTDLASLVGLKDTPSALSAKGQTLLRSEGICSLERAQERGQMQS